MVKKQKPLKGLGARYGIKPRKQFTQVHHLLKSQRKCPELVVQLLEMLLGYGLVRNVRLK